MAVPIVWAVIWVGSRFAIRPLATVAAKQLPRVFAHVKSATKPVLRATNKNPRGVFRADGSLSRANHITPVGQSSPFWNKTFREAAKNPKVANIFTEYAAGMSRKKAVAQLAGVYGSIELANAAIDNYNIGKPTQSDDPRIKALVDAEMNKGQAPTPEDIVAGYREQAGYVPPSSDDIVVRNLPESFGQRMAGALGIVSNKNIPGRDQTVTARTESVPARPLRQAQSYDSWSHKKLLTNTDNQRIDAERAAIEEASPRFTSAELSPYKKVAEPGFGQKLFGLRRSAPEIERDVIYTRLKEQGRDEEADQYWSDWNAENKAKRDAALGEGKSLTEYTEDDADRETSFAEDIVKKVNKALPQKKKGGGRVSSRPKSYRTAKVMKKYAKGGSVRKPKRI